MESDNEEVKDLKIRVFKWNEKLYNIDDSKGLIMFRINNASKKAIQIKHGGGVRQIFKKFEVSVFDLMSLSSRDSTERLVFKAIQDIRLYSEDTILKLSKDVSSYLHSCFKFDIQTPHQKPTIVIAIDVYLSRTMSCNTRKRVSQKRCKKRKVVDVRSCEYVSGNFPGQEVQDIRRMLRFLLEEPMLLWVKPIVSHDREGLYLVEAAMKVKEFDDDDEAVDLCSICLEGICGGMMVATTPCSHMFHRDCLFKWLPNTSRCPMCRLFCKTLV